MNEKTDELKIKIQYLLERESNLKSDLETLLATDEKDLSGKWKRIAELDSLLYEIDESKRKTLKPKCDLLNMYTEAQSLINKIADGINNKSHRSRVIKELTNLLYEIKLNDSSLTYTEDEVANLYEVRNNDEEFNKSLNYFNNIVDGSITILINEINTELNRLENLQEEEKVEDEAKTLRRQFAKIIGAAVLTAAIIFTVKSCSKKDGKLLTTKATFDKTVEDTVSDEELKELDDPNVILNPVAEEITEIPTTTPVIEEATETPSLNDEELKELDDSNVILNPVAEEIYLAAKKGVPEIPTTTPVIEEATETPSLNDEDDVSSQTVETFDLNDKETDLINRANEVAKTNFFEDAYASDIAEVLRTIADKQMWATENAGYAQAFNTTFNGIVENYLFEQLTINDVQKVEALRHLAKDNSDLDRFLENYATLLEDILENPNDQSKKDEMMKYITIFATSLNGFTNEPEVLTSNEEFNEHAEVNDFYNWYFAYDSIIKPTYPMFYPKDLENMDGIIVEQLMYMTNEQRDEYMNSHNLSQYKDSINKQIKLYELQYLMESALVNHPLFCEIKNINDGLTLTLGGEE